MKRVLNGLCGGLIAVGGVVACGGSDPAQAVPGGGSPLYYVQWDGDVGVPSEEDAVVIKACWNDECYEAETPIAGVAPPSSWEGHLVAVETNSAPDTTTVEYQPPPEAGECLLVRYATDVLETCAFLSTANPEATTLRVRLDLVHRSEELKPGDSVSLEITDGTGSLAKQVDTIDEAPPYVVHLLIADQGQ